MGVGGLVGVRYVSLLNREHNSHWIIMSIYIIFYFNDSLFFLCNNDLFSIWFENIWLFQISNQACSCVCLCLSLLVSIFLFLFQNVEKSHGKISVSSKLKSGTGLLPVWGVGVTAPPVSYTATLSIMCQFSELIEHFRVCLALRWRLQTCQYLLQSLVCFTVSNIWRRSSGRSRAEVSRSLFPAAAKVNRFALSPLGEALLSQRHFFFLTRTYSSTSCFCLKLDATPDLLTQEPVTLLATW